MSSSMPVSRRATNSGLLEIVPGRAGGPQLGVTRLPRPASARLGAHSSPAWLLGISTSQCERVIGDRTTTPGLPTIAFCEHLPTAARALSAGRCGRGAGLREVITRASANRRATRRLRPTTPADRRPARNFAPLTRPTAPARPGPTCRSCRRISSRAYEPFYAQGSER